MAKNSKAKMKDQAHDLVERLCIQLVAEFTKAGAHTHGEWEPLYPEIKNRFRQSVRGMLSICTESELRESGLLAQKSATKHTNRTRKLHRGNRPTSRPALGKEGG